jgi:phage tail sheath protein FI
MPATLTYPGVYVEEVPSGVRAIAGVSTADTAFVDSFRRGPMNRAVRITSLAGFQRVFGGVDPTSDACYAIQQYFLNGGSVAWVVRVARDPQPAAAGLALRGGSPLQDTLRVQAASPGTWGNAVQIAVVPGSTADRFNLVVREVVLANGQPVLGSNGCRRLDQASANLDSPNLRAVVAEAEAYCAAKRAFLIVDVPAFVNTQAEMNTWIATNGGIRHPNAAVYFPRLLVPDPASEGRPRGVAASGTLAGVFARIDATSGVWKAPAGTDATLRNATLAVTLTDGENGALNPLGVNALRNFPIFGNISWGARTLVGADQMASEWKYVPVRRTALFIETSLEQGLKWVVFEPNDEPLWAQIRLNVGAFMHNLFRQSAFQGKTPAQAYFVKCDAETTTQNDIDRGIVNVLVGFAPLKPAEFVVIRIEQMAGQVQAA